MQRTAASTAAGEALVAAVTPSASSPAVSPSQAAEATTWTTREALRAGRLSFTPPTLPVGGRRGVPRRE
jgi:hypothetical protein